MGTSSKNIVVSLINQKLIFKQFFRFNAPNWPKSIENEQHIQRLVQYSPKIMHTQEVAQEVLVLQELSKCKKLKI